MQIHRCILTAVTLALSALGSGCATLFIYTPEGEQSAIIRAAIERHFTKPQYHTDVAYVELFGRDPSPIFMSTLVNPVTEFRPASAADNVDEIYIFRVLYIELQAEDKAILVLGDDTDPLNPVSMVYELKRDENNEWQVFAASIPI